MAQPREQPAPDPPEGRERGAAGVHALVLAALLAALWCGTEVDIDFQVAFARRLAVVPPGGGVSHVDIDVKSK